MKSVPLCRDCRFLGKTRIFFSNPPRCMHPCVDPYDPVYGGQPFASDERRTGSKCGPEGKLWKPHADDRGMP